VVKRALPALALLAIGAPLAASCQIVAGLSWSLADAGADAAAGTDAGPGPDAAFGDGGTGPCPGRATYPDPPVGADGPSLSPLVFALHSIDLGDQDTTPGYDLDNVCTCLDDAGPSCAGASTQVSTYCDLPSGPGNEGIDAQAAKFFELIELPVGASIFGSSVFSQQADSGAWSLLVQLDGWSGLPDDPAVGVALFPSPGLGKQPAWDGTDGWPVSAASVGDAGVSTPRFVSNGAYVSGGTLVAALPTVALTLQGGGMCTITLYLTAGVLTGQLLQSSGQWHLKSGILAARWALADVFKSLSSYRDNNGTPVCTNQAPTYDFAKQAICQDADILVDGTQPRSAPCDALSIGLGFTADPALLGPVVPPEAPTAGCPAATDPANDACN
jgi:hypothetical protein